MLEEYFSKNAKTLRKNYPGLSLTRLKREWKNFSQTCPTTQIFFSSLEQGIPLEYIVNQCYFFRSPFYIKPQVFIPRQESEILVELAIEQARSWKRSLHIADVGVGSGNLLLSLLKELPWPNNAVGLDISPVALKVSRKNHFNLSFSLPENSNVRFMFSDRLQAVSEPFDLIISNPPYIKSHSDKSFVHPQVIRHEPHEALFLKDETYHSWYEDFFSQAWDKLVDGGVFMMEGHERHLASLANLAKRLRFSNVKIKQDYNDLDRFLIMEK